VVPIGPAAERKAQQHERDLQRAVDDATASGDPVATYKALEQHAQWLEVMAAWYRLRAGLIEVFRRYEGQTTDEGDTVTVETFADHAGIPVETFRRWLGES
jgi:hypothetical protein